jgi:hypothetical protein
LGIARINIASVGDILNELFPEELLKKIERVAELRLAQNPEVPGQAYDPQTPIQMRHDVIRGRQAPNLRAIWVEYIQHARDVGMLTNGLTRRLTDRKNEDNVRGALSECVAAYALAKDLGFEIVPELSGRDAKNLEFLAK